MPKNPVKNPVRKIITETVQDHPYITTCDTLGEIQSVVSDLISEYGEDALIDFDYDGYYGNGITENLRYFREESDEEMNIRIIAEMELRNKNKADKIKKEEQERKEYERLKLKFEGKTES